VQLDGYLLVLSSALSKPPFESFHLLLQRLEAGVGFLWSWSGTLFLSGVSANFADNRLLAGTDGERRHYMRSALKRMCPAASRLI